jgi:hypothetical protein
MEIWPFFACTVLAALKPFAGQHHIAVPRTSPRRAG